MTCSKCGKDAPLAPRRSHCKECESAYQREYRAKNIDRIKANDRIYWQAKKQDPEFMEGNRKRGREFWQKLRREVMDAYGGAICACCGETECKFLSIDHVFNDGADHRRSITQNEGNGKGASTATWTWLKRNGYPAGFQVLCMNCNFGKATNGGTCPHTSRANENGVNSGKLQTGQSRAKPSESWEGVTTRADYARRLKRAEAHRAFN